MHACVCVGDCVCAHACVRVCVTVCVRVHVCMCVCVTVRVCVGVGGCMWVCQSVAWYEYCCVDTIEQLPLFTGDVYFAWMVFIAIAFLYNAIFMPLRAAFKEEVQPDYLLPLWFFIDYVSDIIFLLDIFFFQSHLSYRDQGVLVVSLTIDLWSHTLVTTVFVYTRYFNINGH